MDRVRSLLAAVLLVGSTGTLAGCGEDVSRAFGFARNSPNEFTVTTQAPLVMPPDEALPPPSPGSARPQDQSPRLGAEEAIAPDLALQGATGTSSPGQTALLEAVDGAASRSSARGEITGGNGGIAGDLAFWSRRPGNLAVDAEAEQQRLRADAADGASPDRGPTPATASP